MDPSRELPEYPCGPIAFTHILYIEDTSIHERPVAHCDDILAPKHTLQHGIWIAEPCDISIRMEDVDAQLDGQLGCVVLAKVVKVEREAPIALDCEPAVGRP
eukprot:scaffold88652_cov35-Tisochrysis_lutea.AAC.3